MRRFVPIFVACFFLSLHLGALLFVNSSLLGKYFEPNIVSTLFFIGALGNLLFFLCAPSLIERFGKHSLLFTFLALTIASTWGMALATSAIVVAFSFIIYSSLFYMIFYLLDIFLEECSLDTKTGELRGAYIGMIHLGLILGLLILTMLTIEENFQTVYLTAGALLIIPMFLGIVSFKSLTSGYHSLHQRHELALFRAWWKTKSIRHVTLAKLALESFYALMVIYTPIYLHNIIGFEWGVLGIMFITMLLPFVLFQWPIGFFADHFVGEKEFMIVGFLIIGGTMLVMPYLGFSFIFWTILLFISRVGASLIEITTDSYFFKHVNAEETGLLSIFRLTKPVSFILGSLVGAVTLNLFSFEKIFFVAAIAAFFGLKESLLLRDTR